MRAIYCRQKAPPTIAAASTVRFVRAPVTFDESERSNAVEGAGFIHVHVLRNSPPTGRDFNSMLLACRAGNAFAAGKCPDSARVMASAADRSGYGGNAPCR